MGSGIGCSIWMIDKEETRRQTKLVFWCLCWQAAMHWVKDSGIFLTLVKSKLSSCLNSVFLQLFFNFLSSNLLKLKNCFGGLQFLILGENQYSEQNPAQLVAEEKISFGINAVCSSFSTIQDIKSSYNEVDGRLVAKEVSCSPYSSFLSNIFFHFCLVCSSNICDFSSFHIFSESFQLLYAFLYFINCFSFHL